LWNCSDSPSWWNGAVVCFPHVFFLIVNWQLYQTVYPASS
jgi:hypothetical protein